MIGLPNATITIPILETPTFSPYTGEPVFSVSTTKSVSVTLEETSPPRELSLTGIDNPIAYLEGRIDGDAPSELIEGQYYQINITLQNQSKNCRFYLVASPSSRMGLDSFFGKAIAGFLTE